MIEPKLFDRDRLVRLLTDTEDGGYNQWLRLVEIVPDYMPPFPRPDTKPTIQVRCLVRPDEPTPGPGIVTDRYAYLRCGGVCGWRSGSYFWDVYGSAFLSAEHALLAATCAPVPPGLLKPMCWERPASPKETP